MRFIPLFLVLLGSTCGVIGAAEAENKASGNPPNIVFILADDLGWRDAGCFGSTYYETPNIDALASRGVRFFNAYAANPLCSPTRASIQTGLYPARIGITQPACHLPEVQLEKKLMTGPLPRQRAINADSLTRLKPEYMTLAKALKASGYTTAHFGKWHLGWNRKDHPEDHYEPKDQGFDIDFPHAPAAAGPGGGYLAPWKFIKDPPLPAPPGTHIEDRMSEEAAKFISEHRDKPFYVNYCAWSVHSPWNARHDYISHFESKADEKNPQHNPLYAAMVKSLDDGVGHILKAIDDAGIADHTIVIFFSDNGGYSYPPKVTDPEGFEHMPATSNLPLRSGKASMYEGGTREPCIVLWPGKTKPGTTNDALLQSTDWFPTLLTMCGLPPPPDLKFDGVDETPTILGHGPVRDRIFCHFPHGSPGQAADINGMLPSTYVRKGDWKLIRFYAENDDGSDRLELYNLKDDIGETRNLAAENPERVGELNELITGFLRDTDAVIPIRNPHYGQVEPTKDDPLAGWKNRGCDAVVKDHILTVTGTNKAPFLGVGANVTGPAKLTFRVRCENGGDGKVEWLSGAKGAADAKSVAFTIKAGGWQVVTADVPAGAKVGILRIYLPAQKQAVEINWVDLRPKGSAKHWDF